MTRNSKWDRHTVENHEHCNSTTPRKAQVSRDRRKKPHHDQNIPDHGTGHQTQTQTTNVADQGLYVQRHPCETIHECNGTYYR